MVNAKDKANHVCQNHLLGELIAKFDKMQTMMEEEREFKGD